MTDQASRLRALVMDQEPAGDVIREPDRNVSIVAVTSGKGGVGKTTIAVNLAVLFAELGERVLLVDADLGLANVDVLLGMEFGRHMGHLLMADYMPEDVSVVGPRGIHVISGGSGLRELADASAADRRMLLDKLAGYYRTFDRVVIDTSPGIGADVTDFLSGADEILLVTTPEPTSLRDTYAALKSIIPLRRDDSTVRLVINMATSEAQAAQAVAVLNEVTDRFLDRRFHDWHFVTSDGLVGRSIRARKPLVCEYHRSAAALCLRQLAGSLQLRAMSGLPESGSVGGR